MLQSLTIHFHRQKDGFGFDVRFPLPYTSGRSHPRGHYAVVVPKVVVLTAMHTESEFQRADSLQAEITAPVSPALCHNPSPVQQGQQDGLSIQCKGAHSKPGDIKGHIICICGQRRI